MRLLSPWALWFLSFLPVIVLMYILKQKFEERQVGSIYLWQQVLKDIEVNTPWQKLKKSLLLLLQLLSIFVLVSALSDPYINVGGGMYSNLIIVIDNTGSMNAKYEGSTRLEKAKQQAAEIINRSGARTNISLLTVERSPRIEIGKTADKGEAERRIKGIKPCNSYGDINDSISLVRSIVDQYEDSSYEVVFFTDSPVNSGDLNVRVESLASELTNVSLDYISYSADNDSLTVLVRVTNRSGEPLSREISLYGDNKILDIKNTDLQGGETATLYFEDILPDFSYIWAELTEKDDLEEDNRVYSTVELLKPRKVLLMSEGNIFIEKVISNINGLELYRTNPDKYTEEGYDLYVFDSILPDLLPKSGSLLLLTPPAGNDIVETGAEIPGGIADIAIHPNTRYMENANFTVSKLSSIKAPFWADILMNIDGNAAAISGEYKGRKTAAICFDLHNSDFVLTAEYPVFIYNLAAYLAGIGTGRENGYLCGDPIDLDISPEAEGASIIDPEREAHKLEVRYPMPPFDNTAQCGVYRLMQNIGGSDIASNFAVNFPVEKESGNYRGPAPETREAVEPGAAPGSIRLRGYLTGFLLLIAAAEWMVYTHGY